MTIDVRRGNDLVMLLAAAFLVGCSSLSGVGGDTQYACPAPRGVQCGSVTANYLQSLQRDLPGQSPTGRVESVPESANTALVTTTRLANLDTDSGAPLRSTPRILTLWVAPWEDRDNVLHDAAFVFVPIDRGRWLVDHVHPMRRLERRSIRPPRPDLPVAPANAGAADPASATPIPSSPASTTDGDAP